MQHIHLIGIGGSGLSAIARLLLESGYEVSGSDQVLSTWAQELIDLGIRVTIGHKAENIAGADLVIRSSAIPENNIEIKAAKEAGIPVLKRHEFLGKLLEDYTGIAIAGTHGKTTTTAMIAWALTGLESDPSYIIGGTSKDLGNNAHAGKSANFVIEADEYDRMFLGLNPNLIIVTNIEHDHPDCYPTPEVYYQVFTEFAGKLRKGGTILVCADDPTADQLGHDAQTSGKVLTYGLKDDVHYRAVDLQQNKNGGYSFTAMRLKDAASYETLTEVNLCVPGLHNVQNALAALATVDQLGLSATKAAVVLSQFTGTGRRFDLLGVANGVTVIDDYAHHPTEIKATIAAARSRYADHRIWAVWQPHTYSRTQMLLDEFCSAFDDADQVIVTEVYAAREKNAIFSSREVVEKMAHKNVVHAPTLEYAIQWINDRIQSGDILLVLSAGNATEISAAVFAEMKEREA